jgi:cytoskeletal protein CcmA (bactofilin family)
MPEIRIKDIDEHEIDTILAEDIDFEGHLTFKKPLMVKGKFKGEIKSSSSLYVGEKAFVEAKIEASLVSSKGRIRGDIQGHSRVELFSTSQLEGDVTTPDFVVESGCKFNGLCNMSGAGPHKETPASHPAHAPASGGNSGQGQGAQGPAAPAQGPAHAERNGAPGHERQPGQGQQGQGQQSQGHPQGQQGPQQGQQPAQSQQGQGQQGQQGQPRQGPQGGGRQ